MKTLISCAILLAAATASSQNTVAIVLDASESMLRRVGEGSLHEGTAAVIVTVVAEAEENDGDWKIGLRLAGSPGDEAEPCSASEVALPLNTPDQERWAEALAAVQPAGPRPLNSAVAAAIKDLPGDGGTFRVVIVTSGDDECGSGKELVAAALAALDLPIELRLVGLELDPSTIEGFGAIALSNATDGDELLAALRWAILDADAPTSGDALSPDPTPTTSTATLTAPPQVTAGQTFDITWSGPENREDFLSLALTASPDDAYIDWARAEDGNPTALHAPDAPGVYEARYVDGETGEALARTSVEVVAVPVEVRAPAVTRADLRFKVEWTGPAASGDFISIAKPGMAPDRYIRWASTTGGSPLTLAAPNRPGPYEVRYVAAAGREVLARTAIEVRP